MRQFKHKRSDKLARTSSEQGMVTVSEFDKSGKGMIGVFPSWVVEDSLDWEEIFDDPAQVKLPLGGTDEYCPVNQFSMEDMEWAFKTGVNEGLSRSEKTVHLDLYYYIKTREAEQDVSTVSVDVATGNVTGDVIMSSGIIKDGEKTTTRYFIKTKKEFTDELGITDDSWRYKEDVAFPVKMDYLFGQEITKEDYGNILKSNPSFTKDWLGDGRQWSIAPYMVKAVEEKIEIQAPPAGEDPNAIFDLIDSLSKEDIEKVAARVDSIVAGEKSITAEVVIPEPQRSEILSAAEKALSEKPVFRYFIKTEEEFIKEFGEGWKVKTNWSERDAMDYLFGVELSQEDYYEIQKTKNGLYKKDWFSHKCPHKDTDWYIYKDMVKEVPFPAIESVTADVPTDPCDEDCPYPYPSVKGAILLAIFHKDGKSVTRSKFVTEDHTTKDAYLWMIDMCAEVSMPNSISDFKIIR
jgi:hypothetical protein